MITGCYLMALLSGARSLALWQRLPMIGVQAVALIVFGGRSAAAAALLLGLAYGAFQLLVRLRNGRLHLLGAAVGALTLAFVPAVIAALTALGFFDILIARFFSDGGSAEARREMFDLLAMFPVGDLLLGPDTDLVDSHRRIQGLEWGIENPSSACCSTRGSSSPSRSSAASCCRCANCRRSRRQGSGCR